MTIVVILAIIYQVGFNNNIHRTIDVKNVDKIELWGMSETRRYASQEELENIVKWFNSVDNIRKNKEFAGITPSSGIIIELKRGTQILIIQSGEDFEIQRDRLGRRVSYWAKQKELKVLLKELAGN